MEMAEEEQRAFLLSCFSHFSSHSSLTKAWRCHSTVVKNLMQGKPHAGSDPIMGWVFC